MSEHNYNLLAEENQVLREENTVLSKELYELKFGLQTLTNDFEAYVELKDFKNAKMKADQVLEKYPNSVEASRIRVKLPVINEEILWQNIERRKLLSEIELYISTYPRGKYRSKVKAIRSEALAKMDLAAYEKAERSDRVEAYEGYLSSYPKGKYRYKARSKIQKIEAGYVTDAYNRAKSKNTSRSWEKFLADYPQHAERRSINEKIIRLKVDEIMADRRTGEMPSFQQTRRSYSSSSSVTIKNDTGYSLSVLYSGPVAKSISIPRGESRATALPSGNYKIAASANGLHYAGKENLSGEYSSTYYITTTTY